MVRDVAVTLFLCLSNSGLAIVSKPMSTMDKITSSSEVGPQGTWGPMRVPDFGKGGLGRQSDADFARGEVSGEINAEEEQKKAEAVAKEMAEAEEREREKAREEQKKAEAVGKWKHAHEQQQQSPFGNLFPTGNNGGGSSQQQGTFSNPFLGGSNVGASQNNGGGAAPLPFSNPFATGNNVGASKQNGGAAQQANPFANPFATGVSKKGGNTGGWPAAFPYR